MRKIKRYGLIPSFAPLWDKLPKFKHYFAFDYMLPEVFSLVNLMPSVYDQRDIGSCVANAWASLIEFGQKQLQLPTWTPSRLFIYFNARDMEGTTNWDAGSMGIDALAVIRDIGYCPEKLWPYDTEKVNVVPSAKCFVEAQKYIGTAEVFTIEKNLEELKSVLRMGCPIAFGIPVFESMESVFVSRTGDIPDPVSSDYSPIGAHEMVLCGWDDTVKRFIIRNSWGTEWGKKGYGTISYDYILNLGMEFGTLKIKSN